MVVCAHDRVSPANNGSINYRAKYCVNTGFNSFAWIHRLQILVANFISVKFEKPKVILRDGFKHGRQQRLILTSDKVTALYYVGVRMVNAYIKAQCLQQDVLVEY